MNVLFVVIGRSAPSTRYRVLRVLPLLEKMGICGRVEEFRGGPLRRMKILKAARGADVVFLQKRLPSSFWLRTLRWAARRLVYDYDDPVEFTEKGPVSPSSTRLQRYRQALKLADAVTVGNELLAEECRRHVPSKPVYVVPLCVDVERFRPKEPRPGPCRAIGWIGSPGNHAHLLSIQHILRAFFAQHPELELRVMSDACPKLDGVPLKYEPFDTDREADVLAGFDVALAPYPPDGWTRGKSSGKLLVYMAAGLPIVASHVECVTRLLEPGRSVLTCSTDAEWREALERLCGDAALRDAIGGEARRDARERFDVAVAARTMAEALRGR